MDSYDAILEHFREAQRRGLDAMSSRFDSIADNFEQAIDAARSAVRDARPADAGDIFPINEVETALAGLRAEAAETTRAAEAAAAAAATAAQAATVTKPVTQAGITLENLQTLDQARSQSELLRGLLPMLAEHVGRAAVLVIRDGVVTAWSGIGFTDANKLRQWNGGIAASPDFQRLVDTSAPLHFSPGSDPLLSNWLAGEKIPTEAVLLPINLRGKLMGIVYLDRVDSGPWNIEAAQALNAVACWLIDTLQHRTTVPSPMLETIAIPEPLVAEGPPTVPFDLPPKIEAVEEPPERVAVAPPAEADFAEVEEIPEPSVKEVAPGPTAAVEEPPPGPGDVTEVYFDTEVTDKSLDKEPPAEIDYDFEPAPAEGPGATAGFDPSATVQVDVSEGFAGAETAPPAFEAPPPVPEIAPEPAPTPKLEEIDAPPPVRPIEPPAPPQVSDSDGAGDDARHEEARRFARLLVSEIKLYNEDDVERGRTDKNLRDRLKDDIERSKEMYEKRIPADVREGNDYFLDELVRILADGDPDALGR